MKTISFKTSPFEMELIKKIVKRAESLGIVKRNKQGRKLGGAFVYDALTCDMDITACHVNCMALDLDALLQADDFNFGHDVCGIARHINRETGQLEDWFVPRFALKQ